MLASVEVLGGAVGRARSGAASGDEATCRDVVAALDRAEELIRVHRGQVLGLIRDEGRWALDGDRDFAGWRARTSGQGRGAARREEVLAGGLDALPGACSAVESGEVSLGHADVLASVLAESSAAVRERLTDGGDEELLATARGVDVPAFRKRVQAWAARIDADAADQDAESIRGRRYLRLTGGNRAVRVEGLLDPVAGATLRTALEALTPAPAVDDRRTPDQRRADALVDLAHRVLTSGTQKPGAQVRPHLNLLVPYDTWLLLLHRRRGYSCGATRSGSAFGRDGGTGADGALARDGGTHAGRAFGSGGSASYGGVGVPGSGGAGPDDPRVGSASASGAAAGPTPAADPAAAAGAAPGAAPAAAAGAAPASAAEPALAEFEDGTLAPFAFLEVLACDCEMTRIVLDADGVPLDVGQTQRSYSKELRRAVLARDRHCRWPGCTMRASWCEVHHCTWYSRGGPTSLDNAVTLCVFHHHEVHRRDITIDVVSGGHRFIRTDGTTLGTSTRHADHLLVPSLLGSGQAGDVRGGGPPGRGSSTVGRQPKGGSSGTRGDPPERRSPP